MRSCLECRWEEAGHEGVLNLLLLTGSDIGIAGGNSLRGGGLVSPVSSDLELTLVS